MSVTPTGRLATLAKERGAALVITAAAMLALLVLAAYALNAAVWFVHHSHLQTQADAAALAGAQALQFPCTSKSNEPIEEAVHKYDGGGVYNAQVGPAKPKPATVYGGSRSEHLLIDELNEPSFTHQSEPGESALKHSPCQEAFVDVKMTETNLRSLFPFAIPEYVNAQARVSIDSEATNNTSAPIAVEQNTPHSVQAELFDESTGKALRCEGAPCSAKLKTTDGGRTWSDTGAPLEGVSFEHAAAGSFPVGLRVALSSNEKTACGETGVTCYENPPALAGKELPTSGIVYIRAWEEAASGSNLAPQALGASLEPVGGAPCNDGYFISTNKMEGCEVALSLTAKVASGLTCKGASPTVSLTLKTPGGTTTMACAAEPPSGETSWTSAPVTVPRAGNAVPFEVSWAQTAGKVGAKTCTTTGSNPCKGTFGTVQRAVSGAYDLASAETSNSGPIIAAAVTNATLREVNSVRRCTVKYSACKLTLIVTLAVEGLRNSESISSPAVTLHFQGTQANGALACAGKNPHEYTQALWKGCPGGPYEVTSKEGTTGCPGSPLPVCVKTNPGGARGDEGISCRIDGSTLSEECSPVSSCTDHNHWVSPNSVSQILAESPPDTRLMSVFITDANAIRGKNGAHDVPIRAFAMFYITGWASNEDPCTTANESPPTGLPYAKDAVVGEGEVVGHFVKYINASPTGTGSHPCSQTGFENCVAVLTK